MTNTEALKIASSIIDPHYPLLATIMYALAEHNIEGEITRKTEVGTIIFKMYKHEFSPTST